MRKLCLIGDVLIDVTLKTADQDVKLRMGGIIHAARCLWALNIPYSVGYFAPSYLDSQIVKYLDSMGCNDITKLGNVIGTPYVFLVNEAKEVGSQGYEFLLRDEIIIENDSQGWKKIANSNSDEYLLISGNYDLLSLAQSLTSSNIHIDLANNIENIKQLVGLKNKIKTVFVSTSSDIFKKTYENDFETFCQLFEEYTQILILKENRGGSRCFDFIKRYIISASSQTQPIVHSIGVGDVYAASFVANYSTYNYRESMILASWIAAEYAVTTYPDDFKTGVTRVMNSKLSDLINIEGVSLPWEKRKRINIYIAAPDFDYVDRTPIDTLFNALNYHNFNPLRPILINGQMEKDASKQRRQELFSKDMMLLEESSILIAVMLYNDPGTLIEIGLASAKGIPTIIYDPYNQAENCMLTEIPKLISNNLDEIISEVFTCGSNFKLNE